MRWAVLLKGLNIGGKRLAMPDLKAFLEGLRFTDVKTLLASGNAVFTASIEDGRKLESAIEDAATKQLELKTEWFVRNHAELAAIMKANPFPDAAKAHPNHLLVHFHRDKFPAVLLDGFTHDGPERLAAHGRELYVDYPADVGHSTLPQAMAKAKFPKLATARNWNTVLKLVELTA
ncbi:MAG: DUF1697 domain-containing protein [Sphingomonas sp.]